MLVYLDGKFINEAKATVSVNNRSFRYGDGCFETIKVAAGKAALLPFHLDRLFASMQLLQFQLPSFFTREYVTTRLHELVLKNGHAALARVRITIFRGDGGIYDAINHQPHLLIQSWPLNPENNKLNENGLVIDFFNEGRKACDAFSHLKSNNYLLYAMAAMHAKQHYCNDALVLNQYGRVADATIANVWIAEGNALVTPPLAEGPVEGTMRRHLLEQAAAKGFQVKEEPVSIERILAADEVFLTNAIYGLKWVRRVAEREFPCELAAAVHHSHVAPLWK